MDKLSLGLLAIVAVGGQNVAQSDLDTNAQAEPNLYSDRQLELRDIGDVNADGIGDFVIGKGWQDIARADEGAVWVVNRSEDCSLGDATRITHGEGGLQLSLNAGDRFGASVVSLGDLDGDGVPDLAVGIPGADDAGWINSGAVHVLFLAADGSVAREQAVSSTQGSLLASLFHGSEFGRQMANMGDIDGDGLPELAVAVSADTGFFAGFIVSLGPDGHVLREQEIFETQGAVSDGEGSLQDLFVTSLTGGSAPFDLTDPSTVGTVVNLTGSDPIADFDSDITAGTRPLCVNFQDLSSGTGLSSWFWDFGENHFSTLRNPLHPFYTIQFFDVSLTVSGTNGTDTAIKNDFIEVTGSTGAIRVNGNDINPEIYESINVPDFGTLWETRINGTSIGGTGLTFIFSFSDWLEPFQTQFGELLVDTTKVNFANSIVAIDSSLGYAAHFLLIPLDVSAFGVAVYTQGFVNNTGMGNAAFTNALYVILATPPGS